MTTGPIEPGPGGMGFGPARRNDLDALAAIERGSPQAWTREAFATELERTPPTLFVLRCKAGAVAFAVIRVQGADMDIVNLAVSPERRRRGLGHLLLSSLLDHAASMGVQSVFLEVREGNRGALALYRNAGFEVTQRRPGFYREPLESAILMRLEMSHAAGLKGPRNAC